MVLLAAAGVTALALSGCSRGGDSDGGGSATEGPASPGITDTTLELGVTAPLSGPSAATGVCYYAGLNAYFEAGNADGGFEFGDGKTREVTIRSYDDAYDPAKALTNVRQMIADDVFGGVASLGTATSLAIMPVAAEEEFPQALVMAGAAVFSEDQEANPWTNGFLPTYYSEGFAFGEMLADRGEEITVATLIQNDDAGEGYLDGLKDAIKGSDVTIIEEATYEASDTSIDAQVTRLAASGADVFFDVVFIPPLAISSLLKGQELGWLPEVFIPSPRASVKGILTPGNATAYPGVYSALWAKNPENADTAKDEDVVKFVADMKEYSSDITTAYDTGCVWSYIAGATLEAAFKKMTSPTRESLMNALHEVSDFAPPMVLPGIELDGTDPTLAVVRNVHVSESDGQQFVPVED